MVAHFSRCPRCRLCGPVDCHRQGFTCFRLEDFAFAWCPVGDVCADLARPPRVPSLRVVSRPRLGSELICVPGVFHPGAIHGVSPLQSLFLLSAGCLSACRALLSLGRLSCPRLTFVIRVEASPVPPCVAFRCQWRPWSSVVANRLPRRRPSVVANGAGRHPPRRCGVRFRGRGSRSICGAHRKSPARSLNKLSSADSRRQTCHHVGLLVVRLPPVLVAKQDVPLSSSHVPGFKGLSPQQARGQGRFSHRFLDSHLSWGSRPSGFPTACLAPDFAGSLPSCRWHLLVPAVRLPNVSIRRFVSRRHLALRLQGFG